MKDREVLEGEFEGEDAREVWLDGFGFGESGGEQPPPHPVNEYAMFRRNL